MGWIATSPRWPRRVAACLIAGALAAGALVSGPMAPRGEMPAVLAAQAADDPFFLVLQALAFDEGKILIVSADGIVTDEDLFGDVGGFNDQVNDLAGGGYAWLPIVPPWLLSEVFDCANPDAACPKTGSDDGAFAEGAYLFYERLTAPPGSVAATKRGEWGPILALEQYPTAPLAPGSPFGGGSHAIITRNDRGSKDVLYFNFVDGAFAMFATDSRSRWKDNDLLTIVPKAKEIQTDPVGWDVYAYSSDGTEPGTGRDTIRADGAPLLTFDPAPTIEFEDAPAGSVAPSQSSAPAIPSDAASAPASAAASAAPSPGGGPAEPTSGTSIPGLAIVAILIGIVIAIIGAWLLFGRRPKGGQGEPKPEPEPPPTTEPPTPEPPTLEPPTPAPPTPPTPEPPPTPGQPPGPEPPPTPGPPSGPTGPIDPGTPDPGPIPPPIPPVPPAPRPRDCDDGDEEWREERPPQSFVVPPADGKVHITNEPTTAALEAWLFGFGFPRGAPFAVFAGLTDEERDRLLDGLPVAPTEIHWTIEFQLDDYRLACQRKWVCDGGAWTPTNELRLLESGPDPYLARFAVDGPAMTVDDVRRIWKDARAVLVAAEAAVSSMASYRSGCA